jgi:hypothetical protein
MRKIIKAADRDPIAKKTFRLEDIQPHWNVEVSDPGRTDISTSVNFRDIYRPIAMDVSGDDDNPEPGDESRGEGKRRRAKPKAIKKSRKTSLKSKHRASDAIGSQLLGMKKWRDGAKEDWKGKHDPRGEDLDVVRGVVEDEEILGDELMDVDEDGSDGGDWNFDMMDVKEDGDEEVDAEPRHGDDDGGGDGDSGDGDGDSDGSGECDGGEDEKFQERFRPVHVSNKEWHSRAWHNGAKTKREFMLRQKTQQVIHLLF